jgi:hypothetical protein
VVDVEVGVRRPALHCEVDEGLEHTFFVVAGQCPVAAVDVCSVIVLEEVAEEVLVSELAGEGVAFEVEEDVAG